VDEVWGGHDLDAGRAQAPVARGQIGTAVVEERSVHRLVAFGLREHDADAAAVEEREPAGPEEEGEPEHAPIELERALDVLHRNRHLSDAQHACRIPRGIAHAASR
jgi:hypothetical protein